MHYSKNKITDLLSPNSNDFILRILLHMLNEIKEHQIKSLHKAIHGKIEQMFKIIINVSMLYNQLCYLSKDDIVKKLHDSVLKINRENVEKSFNDYFSSINNISDL